MNFKQNLFPFLLFKIVLSKITLENQINCDVDDFFKIFFRENSLNCLIVHNMEFDESLSKCLVKYLQNSLSISIFQNFNITNHHVPCDTHLIFDSIKKIDFPPFSKLVLINNLTNFTLSDMFLKSLNIFEIKIELFENRYIVLPEFKSLIQNKSINWIESKDDFLSERNFVNILLRNEFNIKTLRTSFFNCPPFVITTGSVLDGVEIRLVQEIAKNWNLTYFPQQGWTQLFTNTREHLSDLSLCSVWETEKNFHQFDLTIYFEHQCGTFIVQKPSYLNEATYIYIPFDFYVWMAFIAMFLTTAFMLRILTSLGFKICKRRWESSKFNSLTYCFLEIVNTTTSHGVTKFPTQIPIRILITCWMMFILLIGTGYTTEYTSLLTSPPTSKPIDTVNDFIDAKYFWGEEGVDKIVREFKNSEKYTKFIDFVQETSQQEQVDFLLTKKYGRFVKVLSSKNYITDTETFSHLAKSLRLLKECLFNYYIILAFQKNSGFKTIFDQKIVQ